MFSNSSFSHAASIHIRPLAGDDRDFVLGLAPRLVIGIALWRDKDKMLTTMQRFICESIDAMGPEAAVLVAEDAQGTRLGFVSIARGVNFTGEVQAYIGELAVSANAEGTGAGRALVEAAENWARMHGYRLVVLDTGAANTHARAFYQHLGYAEESVRLVKVLEE